MSVKSKRRERKRKLNSAKAKPGVKVKANAEAEENYSLNSILADFRANKEAEQAAEGIKPVKDADFDDVFDVPETPEASAPEERAEFTEEREELIYETPIVGRLFSTSAPETIPESVAQTPEAVTETLFDASVTESVTETPEAVTETLFDASVTESVTETPETVTETLFDASVTESVTETPETVAEMSFDASITESAAQTPEAVAEMSFDASITESVTETPETVAETLFDASVTESAAQTPESVAETSFDASITESVTETPPEASASDIFDAVGKADTDTLSDTQAFERPAPRKTRKSQARLTLWQRLFGRRKAAKDLKESVKESEPQSVSLEEVVGNTVDAVKADAAFEGRTSRRSLFSRQRMRDADEELPMEEAEFPEVVGPEPALKIAAEQTRKEYVKRIEGILPAIIPAILPTLVLILESLGLRLPFLTGSVILRPLLLLLCMGAALWLCRGVFTDNRCTATFLCGVSAIAACLDCITMPFLSGRSMAEPYGAIACLALLTAKLGSSLESHGNYDTFHAAGLDRNPPYLVTESVQGTRKQRGAVTGFYTATLEQNFSTRWQTLFLPVTLAASLVFAGLSSFGLERGSDFFLNWSAILAAGATLVLPFCWGLPWARLAARLKKSGCAIAGWRGAERIAHKKKMIVTDSDLFPPGAVLLEDVRLYEEEMPAVVSITASMIRESGCGLERIFDDLLKSEGGEYLPVRDFHFYEVGGFSGTIGEDKILLGTSSFLRKMSVQFPGDFYFPMGLYLSVNGELAATFALRYDALENVDFALRLMRRNRVTAILAARDPNVTPKLLQRVFRRKIDVDYPGLNNRIALSAMSDSRQSPRGLLFREGLLPYAETVVGSLRLCAGVKRSTRLALFGSAVGTLLSFYLVYQAKYYLLSPLNLLLFLFLWTVPAVLLMDLT